MAKGINKEIQNMSTNEAYFYVYEIARKNGDKFPEVVAAQFALETDSGTKMADPDKNNVLNQKTFKKGSRTAGKTEKGTQMYWAEYNSIEDAIKDRIKRWNNKYSNAKDPISAMAMIQPSFAPNSDKNQTYMSSIASILKKQGFYNGDTNLPNSDVNPDYYKKRRFNPETKVFERSVKSYDETLKSYQDQLSEIDKEDNENLKKLKIKELNRKFYKNGDADVVNKEANFFNKNKQKEAENFIEGNSKGGFIYSLLKNDKLVIVDPNKISGGRGTKIPVKPEDAGKTKFYFKNLTQEEFNRLKKEMPLGLIKANQKSAFARGPKFSVKGDNASALLNIASKEYADITGGKSLYNDKTTNLGVTGTVISPFTTEIKNLKNITADFNTLPKNEGIDIKKQKEQDRIELDQNKAQDALDAEGAGDPQFDLSLEKAKLAKANALKSFNAKAEDAFGEFFQKEEIVVPENFTYDKDSFGTSLPIEAVAQGALGLIGLSDAETELPLRDEKVSQAILNFSKEQKKLSEIGLRPEEEAKMKNDLAEAYQQGISQLTRASGGNRNIVLGGLNSLNANRQRGILDISLADIKRKDDAYDKYGKTLEYIENFNTNRDIANHGIKLNEAKEKRTAGASLASKAFSSMIEEIQFQKENGPGSANHMLKKALEFEQFGVALGMKDDRTGTVVGTPSYRAAQNAKIEAKNANIRSENKLNTDFLRKLRSLSDNEKLALGPNFINNTKNDPVARKSFIDGSILEKPEEPPKPSPISQSVEPKGLRLPNLDNLVNPILDNLNLNNSQF